MTTLRQVLYLIRTLPDEFAGWLARLVMRGHRPVPVGPNNSTPWCLACNVMWPCDVYVKLSDGPR